MGPIASNVEPASGKRGFAVVLTWPEIKNAEYEVIKRIIRAAHNIDARVYIVDNDGYPLSWDGCTSFPCDERITRADCDFVISLHFESPKLYDIYSYTALWNPPEFYKVFGYANSTMNLVTHNDVLSCESDIADQHAANVYQGYGRVLRAPLPTFFHSLPGPYLAPRITDQSRLFYVGINWERISGEKGRHHDLLVRLDAEDLINIFGPTEFGGVEPWRGFRNYRGSVPFDGSSILEHINEAGVCLALSSSAHQRAGIMSTRLFEGLAAGAAIISNPNPFLDKYFGDCVYVVEDHLRPDELATRVRDMLLDIRRHPSEAMERARIGQERLKERFSLELCLESLFSQHADRVRWFNSEMLGGDPHEITVILSFVGTDLEQLDRMIGNVSTQANVVVDLRILCDKAVYEAHRDRIECHRSKFRSLSVLTDQLYHPASGLNSPDKRLKASGPLFEKATRDIRTEFFCMMHPDEVWFKEHLASLVNALSGDAVADFACSGRLREQVQVGTRKTVRQLDELVMSDFYSIVEARHAGDVGRFVYRTRLLSKLPSTLLQLLDGLEPRALHLWAYLSSSPAQTGYASFMQIQRPTGEAMVVPRESEELQVELILDSVRGDAGWLQKREQFPRAVSSPAGFRRPHLRSNHMYGLGLMGDGSVFMAEGFSHLEESFTWIDGHFARLEFNVGSKDELRQLVFLAAGRNLKATNAPQTCIVTINDEIVGKLSAPEVMTTHKLELPVPIRPSSNAVRIGISLSHAEQVFGKTGQVIDRRNLGLRLGGFGFLSAASAKWDNPDAVKSDGPPPRSLFRRVAGRIARPAVGVVRRYAAQN